VKAIRGNPTKIVNWLNTGSSTTTTATYDETGQILSSTDACGNGTCSDITAAPSHTTTYSYSDSPAGGNAAGNSNAYLTSITDPLGHNSKYSYAYPTGQVVSTTDENGQTTTYKYSDSLNRLTLESFPDGGCTSYSYNDSVPSMTTTQLISTGNPCPPTATNVSMTSVTVWDGMQHVIDSELTSAPGGTTITVASTYDGEGRIYSKTNPYQTTSDPTYGTTYYTYDPLGRPVNVTHPDSTALSYSYAGAATQIKDESGYIRTSQNDGLGRMTSVCESSATTQQGGGINASPGNCSQNITTNDFGFLTTYSYDALNNLTTVAQGTMQRSFLYDSLSRLVCAYNPEFGPSSTSLPGCAGQASNTAYAYDANSNLTSRIRWAPNQPSTSPSLVTATTAHTYDALDRVLTTTYTDGDTNNSPTPPSSFVYDAQIPNMSLPSQPYLVGRLSAEYTTQAGQLYTGRAIGYDQMGRTAVLATCDVDDCPSPWYYELAYVYDLSGNTTSQTLLTTQIDSPTIVFSYVYNLIDQLTSMTSSLVDANHPKTLFSGASYSPLGGLASANLGNGAIETINYDQRGRLACDRVVNGSTTLYNLGLSNSTSSCPQSGFAPKATGYAGNGDVLQYTDSVNGSWTVTYDDLNRIHNAIQAAGAGPLGATGGTMSWLYDRFGNRWTQNQTGLSPQQFSFTTGNNQIAGYSYDAAGNLLNDGVHSYTYDDENRISTASLIGGGYETYSYDAEGRRIRKTSGTPEEYVYDKDDHQIGEMLSDGNFNRIELYAGNRHIATYDNVNLSGPSARAIFIHGDWLGTERARSLYDGTSYQTCNGLPFGDQQTCTMAPSATGYGDPSPLHFTGRMRDVETNLDYFGARYFSSGMGRWMSPDWAGKPTTVPYADFGNPQSLNLYGYTGDNPLTKNDLDGHCTNHLPGVVGGGSTELDCENDIVQDEQQDKLNAKQQSSPTLPKNPSGLGPDWTDITPQGGQNPKIPKRFRGPKGTELEFDPANPDKPPSTWAGTDHWHEIGPDGKRVGGPDGHLEPGSPIPGPDGAPPVQERGLLDQLKSIPPEPIVKLGTAAIITYIIVSEGTRLIPARNLIPIP